MCFSAAASFGASAVLLGAGVVAMKKAESPRLMPFAVIPFFFGLQQITEGVLWMTFNNPELLYLQDPSIYIFILFAKVVWPFWIPFAVLKMEKGELKRRILKILLILGSVSALQMIVGLIVFKASVSNGGLHIDYNFTIPYLRLHQVIYMLACAIPFYVSSLKFMKLLGTLLIGTWILSVIFYTQYAFSVWCFFAALLSVVVILILNRNEGGVLDETPSKLHI